MNRDFILANKEPRQVPPEARTSLTNTPLLLIGVAVFALSPFAVHLDAKEPKSPPRTDLYGDPLPDHAIARLGTSRLKHGGLCRCVAYSPDGKMVASGGDDRVHRLWDAESGKALRTFDGYSSFVISLAFAPDGKTLASGDDNDAIRIWDLCTGKQLLCIQVPACPWDLSYSPDGKMLASAGFEENGHVYIWDPATGNELRRWLACSGSVYNVAFSPDGNTLASGGETTTRNADAKSTEECTVAVWDPKTGRKLRECFIGRACHGVAFSPDGKLLAAAFDDRHDKSWIGLYDPAAGKELARIRAYAAFIAFAPDGKTLAVRKGDMVQFRSVPDLKPTGSVPTAYDSGADALAFSPDGKSLAVCDSSRIRLWDLTTKKEKSDLPGHQREIVSLTIPHDGKTVITAGSWDGTARRWDIATGKQLQVFQGKHDDLHGTLVWSASLSPDGKKLALAHAGAAGVTLL